MGHYTADSEVWMGDAPSSGDHWQDIMTRNGMDFYALDGMTLDEAVEAELPEFLEWLNSQGPDSTGFYSSLDAFEADDDDSIYRFRGDVICKTPRQMLSAVIEMARQATA